MSAPHDVAGDMGRTLRAWEEELSRRELLAGIESEQLPELGRPYVLGDFQADLDARRRRVRHLTDLATERVLLDRLNADIAPFALGLAIRHAASRPGAVPFPAIGATT